MYPLQPDQREFFCIVKKMSLYLKEMSLAFSHITRHNGLISYRLFTLIAITETIFNKMRFYVFQWEFIFRLDMTCVCGSLFLRHRPINKMFRPPS